MGSLVCTAISGIIAFVTYSLSRDAKEAGDNSKERLLTLASLVAGLVAVLSILALIAGP